MSVVVIHESPFYLQSQQSQGKTIHIILDSCRPTLAYIYIELINQVTNFSIHNKVTTESVHTIQITRICPCTSKYGLYRLYHQLKGDIL